MNDAGGVSSVEAPRDVTENRDGAECGHEGAVLAVLAHDPAQVPPSDVLHREEVAALVASKRVDMHDVLVAHGRERGSFAPKTVGELVDRGVARGDDLDRDEPIEVYVAREIDDAHRA